MCVCLCVNVFLLVNCVLWHIDPHMFMHTYIYTFFFHHTTCESTCDNLPSSAANQGDNTVSVAQVGTSTPGIYIYIYIFIYI